MNGIDKSLPSKAIEPETSYCTSSLVFLVESLIFFIEDDTSVSSNDLLEVSLKNIVLLAWLGKLKKRN